MPLALIGNEYVDVVSRLEREDRAEKIMVDEKLSELDAIDSTYKMELNDIVNLTSDDALKSLDNTDKAFKQSEIMVIMKKSVELAVILEKEVTKRGKITPNILMIFSELKAVTPVMLIVLKVTSRALGNAWKKVSKELKKSTNIR